MLHRVIIGAFFAGAGLPHCVTATAPDSGTYGPDHRLTVAVTDSGLGGLSVIAAIERDLRESGVVTDVDLVFCNALFDADSGYNSLPTRDAKVAMFDRALEGLAAECRPDLIVIACNTLSVISRDTKFAGRAGAPILDIVNCGVDLVSSHLPPDGTGAVILFGTETTIDEGAHKAALVARGIAAGNIATQACPQLASCIESGFDSEETMILVDAYVTEATTGFADAPPSPLYASLNCTHYGYAIAAWQAAFAAHGIAMDGILDPNRSLADAVREWLEARGVVPARTDRPAGRICVRAVSMPEIPPTAIASISRWLESRSAPTAAALRAYEQRQLLFPISDLWPVAAGR